MHSASTAPAVDSMALMRAPVITVGRRRRSPCLVVLATCLVFATMLGLVLLPVERNTLFVSAAQKQLRNGKRDLIASRAGDFSFGIAESDDYTCLKMVEQDDGAMRVSTQPTKTLEGRWNTVLGDAPLPDKGRHYWEIKIVKKPTDIFECIGVAEPSADVTVPLNKNKKGNGWFWASGGTESMHWVPADIDLGKFEDGATVGQMELIMGNKFAGTAESAWAAKTGTKAAELPFDFNKNPTRIQEDIPPPKNSKYSGVVGTVPSTSFPAFDQGMVVGVDVDMDQGTLGFWADGKYLGIVRDMAGKPVNLKGKKVVPAISLYGATSGGHSYSTVMEVKSGLEAPAKA